MVLLLVTLKTNRLIAVNTWLWSFVAVLASLWTAALLVCAALHISLNGSFSWLTLTHNVWIILKNKEPACVLTNVNIRLKTNTMSCSKSTLTCRSWQGCWDSLRLNYQFRLPPRFSFSSPPFVVSLPNICEFQADEMMLLIDFPI